MLYASSINLASGVRCGSVKDRNLYLINDDNKKHLLEISKNNIFIHFSSLEDAIMKMVDSYNDVASKQSVHIYIDNFNKMFVKYGIMHIG